MSDDTAQSGPDETSANRRRFLKGLGALSVVGLAGCGGDGDDETPTDTPGGNGNGNGNGMGDTETPTEEPTATPTEEPTDTPTTTPTPTEGPRFTDNPAQLISFSGSPQVAPGETATVSGSIQNPYLFTVTDGEFTLEPPNDDWSVSAVSGTTFDSLESQAQQSVAWEVTAPESAGGTFELSVSGTYQGPDGEETAEVSTTLSILARAPGQAPLGIDCGGGHFDEVPVIDGLPFMPTEDQRADIEFSSDNVIPVPEEFRWWTETGNITVEPPPNSFGPGGDIAETDADALYAGEWWQEDTYTVTIDIENGTYDVTFHLAEIAFSEEGARVFGATVNGETAFEELDIYAEVGAGTALTRSIEGVEVTDNTLEIVLESSVENPKCGGIEIREA